MTRRQRSSDVPSDVLLTLAELGIDIDRVKDDEAWARCPGHFEETGKQDRHASWSINVETGDHHCFSCGWGGSFLRLVRYVGELDEEAARAWIRRRGGIEVAAKRLRGETAWEKKKAEEVTEANLVFFDPPPRAALKSRDVTAEACAEYGVLWDPKNSRWIFPIREPYTNKLLGWQEKGKGYFRNHPEHVEKAQTIFGFNVLLKSASRTAYLYESPIDPVRLWSYDIDTPVSSYGVHVSDVQLDLLADEVDTLYVCLDNDPSGRKVEAEIWETHRKRFRKMYFANYSRTRKKDHGEMPWSDVRWSLDNAISSLRYRP